MKLKSLGIEIYAIVDWFNIHYLFLAYQDESGRSVYYYYYLVKLSEEGLISKLLPVLSSTNMHECCIWAYVRTYLNAESGPWVSDAWQDKVFKANQSFYSKCSFMAISKLLLVETLPKVSRVGLERNGPH